MLVDVSDGFPFVRLPTVVGSCGTGDVDFGTCDLLADDALRDVPGADVCCPLRPAFALRDGSLWVPVGASVRLCVLIRSR